MSQHGYQIPNQSGSAFRADNNNAHQAHASLNAGASAPATAYQFEPWADTSNGVLKQRNAANSGWIIRDTLAETRVISRGSNTILGLGDYGCTFVATGTFSQTLTAAATLADGWHCFYRNDGSGVITLDPNGGELIDGAATIALQPGESCRISCTGSAFKTQGRAENKAPIASPSFTGPASFAGLIDASAAGAGQIKFPASQNASADANTLDDYEEGTWTPNIGGTATYSLQIGTYTKIGNRCLISCYMAVSTLGSGQTNSVLGLPFTAFNLTNQYTAVPVTAGAVAASIVSAEAAVWPNTTFAVISSRTAAATTSAGNTLYPGTVGLGGQYPTA